MISIRRFSIAVGSAALCAAPLVAQRGAPPARTGTGAARPDSLPAQGAFALDFQNQELQVVLSALAEAGNLNITMTNIPAQRVTVRMARGFTRDTLVTMIRGLSEANGVRFTAQGSLIRLEGDPSLAPAAQQTAAQRAAAAAAAQQQAAVELKLYTYRLKHANAVTVAPVLMNLLGVTTGAGFGGGAGGLQFTQVGGGRGGAGGVAGVVGAGGGGGGRGAAAAVAQQQALVQGILGNVLGAQQGAPGTLSNASSQIRIVADEPTNSLLIRSTLPDFQLIQQLMQGIDLRPLQVLIEVTIAEVSRSSDVSLGVGGTATRRGATNNAPRDTVGLLPGNASARDFIFKLASGNGSINYTAALNALQTRGDVKVLSMPVIIAQNNKEAILNVGEQRPFVQVNQSVTTGTVPTTVQTIQYIPVGTTLTITPTINPDGYVNMAVNQTNDAATNEVQFNAPVISKREATTQIFLRDGQTTVIGGLAGNSTTKTVSGVPILSRIPFIGGLLFGNTSRQTTTNELFLFLTPHIISSDEDIERYRNSLEQSTELLKDMPLGPRIAPEDSAKRFLPPDTTRRRPPGPGR